MAIFAGFLETVKVEMARLYQGAELQQEIGGHFRIKNRILVNIITARAVQQPYWIGRWENLRGLCASKKLNICPLCSRPKSLHTHIIVVLLDNSFTSSWSSDMLAESPRIWHLLRSDRLSLQIVVNKKKSILLDDLNLSQSHKVHLAVYFYLFIDRIYMCQANPA